MTTSYTPASNPEPASAHTPLARIHNLLTFLYGADIADAMQPAFAAIMARTRAYLQQRAPLAELTEQDALLIAYGDSIHAADETPLQSLHRFLTDELGSSVSGVHILPFYPYTSDDGFSVVDYRQIDPALGTWQDVIAISRERRIMFDAVVNHISQASAWFQGFLRRESPWRDYFVSADPAQDLSMVVRPRTLPLLTPYETAEGVHHLWTTFSADQIDLNFANPQVALEIADLLLFYAEQGAGLIRLDAIAYLWKQPGTRSIHLPQTHAVVKLLRAVLDGAAPNVQLITETNVPHADNISYFGAPLPAEALPEGVSPPRSDEAQLVYQFSLAPLILHTFATNNAEVLTRWASELGEVPGAFFNFTASHDGIGVLPALGYLSSEEVMNLAARAQAHGGRISYRSLPDGSQTPYELNITFYDALNDPAAASEWDVARFLASQAIMLSLAGMPGIYFQSLFGARNCHACLEATGRARSINREKFAYDDLVARLHAPESREAKVYNGYKQLLNVRRQHRAFHPLAPQRVLALHPQIFALLRHTQDWRGTQGEAILCLINVTGEQHEVSLPADLAAHAWRNLLPTADEVSPQPSAPIALAPYQILWLQHSDTPQHKKRDGEAHGPSIPLYMPRLSPRPLRVKQFAVNLCLLSALSATSALSAISSSPFAVAVLRALCPLCAFASRSSQLQLSLLSLRALCNLCALCDKQFAVRISQFALRSCSSLRPLPPLRLCAKKFAVAVISAFSPRSLQPLRSLR